MIKVTVELISAVDRSRDQVLGIMHIDNVTDADKAINKGGNVCDYHGEIKKKPHFDKNTRHAVVENHRRHDLTIWHLVAKMLKAMNYI